jgi:UDP-N-acetylmuramate: L-alanyl-gamma-D-glutamyl-meso-diaminopimelate ligase
MQWTMTGEHNVRNALAAIAAARHVGIDLATSVAALREFEGVKRRMEHLGTIEGESVYDDFAHHPTAIDTTLRGMAAKMAAGDSGGRLIAIIEPRSNTMKLGIHQADLAAATAAADLVLWKKPEKSGIDFHTLLAQSKCPAHAFEFVEEIVCFVEEDSAPEDQIVIMSNGGFDNIHQKLLSALGARRAH